MIFLDYLYNLPNSTGGIDTILVDTVSVFDNSPVSFTPLLMAFVFFIVFLGGVSRQKMRSGFADYPLWCLIGSLATYLIALLMSVIEGMIRLDILIIITVITIFSGVWLFLDRKQSGV